jgi:AraC family transcriptional regulator
MDWVARMNRAIRYIEEHLTETIDYAEAAKAACCSVCHFRRLFSFIAGVSLSEYIRRRRLTLAAFELQNGRTKVVDLALKYGYDSPEAFTRAFQQLHGTTPTAARSAGIKLKAYPPLSFQFLVKGAEEVNYRIEEKRGFSIVGVQERVDTDQAFHIVPGLWAEAAREGLFERLWQIRADDRQLGGILGVCADGEHGKNEEFRYILSIESDEEPPAGMVKRDFPAAAWAVFEAYGGPEGIAEIWRRLYTEWLPASAYDLAYLPAIECYLPPEENRNELWVAVVPRCE